MGLAADGGAPGAPDTGTGREIRAPGGGSLEVKVDGGPALESSSGPGSGDLVFHAEEPAPARCSFCNRTAAEAWLMVQGPAGAHICDSCLAFCLATVAGHTGGGVRFGAESATGQRSVSGIDLPQGEWETVRRCPNCGTYTLSPRAAGPLACANCDLHFPDAGAEPERPGASGG